jgi:glycosyltransferase involved in cell wall biosynthesis
MHDIATGSLAFCTIVSKNYLAQARVLAESLARHYCNSPLFVLLADRIDDYFDPSIEPFRVIEIEELLIPDLPRFCFQYSVLELNTAAKPYFLEYLFQSFGIEKLVYLDPDIVVFNKMGAVSELLDTYAVLLTPHIISPYPEDGRRLSEIDLLRTGAYNLGFLALRDGATTAAMLEWWKKRLYSGCRHDLDRGLHVDQKWIDLVPGLFPDVLILRDPGYNIAYWNLNHRPVSIRGGQIWVHDCPGYFFHFSGFDPARPDQISIYQDRLTTDEIGDARLLFREYEKCLQAQRHSTCRNWPYAFGKFDNGVEITSLIRRMYLEMGDRTREYGNPFLTAPAHSYYRYLTEAVGNGLPALFQHIYYSRPDLRTAYPEINGKDRSGYLEWISNYVQEEYDLDERLLKVRSPAPTGTVKAEATSSDRMAREQRPFGVNLTGYFQSEKGVGEACRAVLRALEAARIPFVVNNVLDWGSANLDTGYSAYFQETNPYAVNLIQMNADQIPLFFDSKPEYGRERFNIGYWNWELSDFPSEWCSSFRYFDEVWAPSMFTTEAIAAGSPIPVRHVPFSVWLPSSLPPRQTRERWGLPAEAFVFLFAFDFHSFLERKNPLAVIEAFQKAFADQAGVYLVIKTCHAQDKPADWRAVRSASAGCRNIKLINRVVNRAEMHALMMLCDAYVSLHRAEGFGLGLAEAMALGKPVMGTAYSAPLDFMNTENSYPVRCQLIPIDRDHGPYRAGSRWADPDVGHAAETMRRIVQDREEARQRGQAARRHIARDLSPQVVGEMIYSRLVALTNRIPASHNAIPARTLLENQLEANFDPTLAHRRTSETDPLILRPATHRTKDLAGLGATVGMLCLRSTNDL